jgi:hypothetical protein
MTSGGGSRDGGAKFGVQEGASLRLDEEREEERRKKVWWSAAGSCRLYLENLKLEDGFLQLKE